MIVPGSVNPLLISGGDSNLITTPCGGVIEATPSNGYKISNSLRFRRSASSYLSYTPRAAGNRAHWSLSMWVKRGRLSEGEYPRLLSTAGNNDNINFMNDDKFRIELGNTGNAANSTAAVFRDPAAWMHIVVMLDASNATQTERFKLYINGDHVNAWSSNSFPNPGFQSSINDAVEQNIGRFRNGGSDFFDGYMADIRFIDGATLDISEFGYREPNGVWRPKSYSGAYGAGGYWLKFDDAANIGKDSSGNNNHWTPHNIDVAAPGTQPTYDLMKDSPTPYDDGTPNPPGNYCTFNPLGGNTSMALTDGNLKAQANGGPLHRYMTVGISSGKWFWEYTCGNVNQGTNVGVSNQPEETGATWNGMRSYYHTGQKIAGATATAYGVPYGTGAVIGVALDMDAGTVGFYLNGTDYGVAHSGLTGVWFPMLRLDNGDWGNVNFGQHPFKHAPPAGYKGLCTTNLPMPSITDGKKHFDVALGAGAGILAQAQALTPHDLIWIKDRANQNDHQLIDVVRGASVLNSNTENGEHPYVAPSGNSVAWCWKAGGAPVANNDGTIASQVSANKCGGFSIVSYTGNGNAGATVGHGLGVKPNMIMVKRKTAGSVAWGVWHSGLDAQRNLFLNQSNGQEDGGGLGRVGENTSSTTFGFHNTGRGVETGVPYIAYCWTAIPGMSAIGKYIGNGNDDGTFVYCGFTPRWVLIKRMESNGDPGNWMVMDTSRDTFNKANNQLYLNMTRTENGEGAVGRDDIDILSNGFKLRGSGGWVNAGGNPYAYAAFAEHPFKIANAR